MRTRLTSIIMTLCMAMLAVSCSLDIPGQRNAEAYIISVGLDYVNSPVSSLQGTVDDALEIAMCLSDIYDMKGIGHHEYLMIQEGADSDMTSPLYPSADNILSTIRTLPVTKNDLVIFYYSGHGDVDAQGKGIFAAARRDDEELYSPLYMDEVYEALGSLPSQSLMIVDACYSGDSADESPSSVDFMDSIGRMFSDVDLRGVSAMAACQPDELSYVSSVTTMEGYPQAHSEFTIGVLDALGWVHTSSSSRLLTVDGKERVVEGRLGSVPEKLSAKVMFAQVVDEWTSSRQEPIMNSTPIEVMIVPG